MKSVLLSLTLLSVLAPSLSAATKEEDAAELAAVFQSLGNVLDLAVEVERYRIGHGRLPLANSPLELSRLVIGTTATGELFVRIQSRRRDR